MFGILAMNVGDKDAVTVLDFIVKTMVKVCYPPFHIIQSLILVLYGPAQSDMSRKVRVGPDELKYIIKGGPRIIILVVYGWAQIYDICDLRVGPPPYNIIINRTLRVGPDRPTRK